MSEIAAQIVQRFQRIYIGDSVIQRLEIDFRQMQCVFLLHAASILKAGSDPNIFDPEQRYEPAKLVFRGVDFISCPEGEFFLNATIVDFEATADPDSDLVVFHLQMTGGHSNETFMRSLVVRAQSFSLEAA